MATIVATSPSHILIPWSLLTECFISCQPQICSWCLEGEAWKYNKVVYLYVFILMNHITFVSWGFVIKSASVLPLYNQMLLYFWHKIMLSIHLSHVYLGKGIKMELRIHTFYIPPAGFVWMLSWVAYHVCCLASSLWKFLL